MKQGHLREKLVKEWKIVFYLCFVKEKEKNS